MVELVKMRPKLIAAAAMLIIALVLLVATSLAWFTISTNPEISGFNVNLYSARTVLLSLDNETYTEALDLSEKFNKLAPLKPVSTVDGLNWFLPTYDNITGELNPARHFELDDNLTYANILYIDEATGKPLEGKAKLDAMDNGYYVYTDFYMKTEEEKADVRLSFSNPVAYYTEEYNDEDTSNDGTFVLPSYKLDNSTGSLKAVNISKGAERSARIGFLIEPDYTGTPLAGTAKDPGAPLTKDISFVDFDEEIEENPYINRFIIYEPNSDNRTSIEKPHKTEPEIDNLSNRYIIDYDFDNTTYTQGLYYETLPIRYVDNTTYQPVRLNSDNVTKTQLVVQKSSFWMIDNLTQTMQQAYAAGTPKWWSSKDVQYPFGSFENTTKIYNKLQPSSIGGTGQGIELTADDEMQPSYGSDVILRLYKDTPIRIRMFVWIEGQDIDCWNDISAGGFVVNLEFGGETIEARHTDDESGNNDN